MVGNGSDELIHLLIELLWPGDEVVIAEPTSHSMPWPPGGMEPGDRCGLRTGFQLSHPSGRLRDDAAHATGLPLCAEQSGGTPSCRVPR